MTAKPQPTAHAEPSPSTITDEMRTRAKYVLKLFLEKFGGEGGVRSAAIAAVDGFDIAVVAMSEEEGKKLSALSSSISAIGDMAASEVGIGDHHQSITIESERGYVFILKIPHPLCPMILCINTSKESMLGKLLYYAKQVAAKMCEP